MTEEPRRGKVVATIGPSSDEVETVVSMAEAGMDVARINASHTTEEALEALIETVEAARERLDRPLGLMVDLQGPEIRTGDVEAAVELESGSEVTFVTGDAVTDEAVGLTVDVSRLSPGDRVLLHDGRIETTVQSVSQEEAVAQVDVGGAVDHRVGVNLPGVELGADMLTEKDEADLDIAAAHDVDMVAASFVRDAEDVYAVVGAVEAVMDAFVVAKVERAAAVENLHEIIAAADGVMVARGDLGVECPLEEVPTIQKRMIRAARDAGKPVIIATEMLESMIHGARPTRAEASDVANAVLDGTDAVMLSGETAVGDHPVKVVAMMDRIIRGVERSHEYDVVQERIVPSPGKGVTESLAAAARELAGEVDADAIIVESESGSTARSLAKFRPSVPVVAATQDPVVARQLMLSWGISVDHTRLAGTGTDEFIVDAVAAARDAGAVADGDTVLILSGMFRGEAVHATDLLKVHVLAERLAAGTGVVPGRGTGEVVHLDDGNIDAVPPGAVVVLPESATAVEGGFGPLSAVLYEGVGRANRIAATARDYGVPLVCGIDPGAVPEGETVTVDAVRGVVYRGDLE